MWPKLVMADGKPQHPQSQGSVEHAISDIKDVCGLDKQRPDE